MFAGEGTPERTNRRFHYLSRRPAGRAPVDRVRLGHAVRRRPGAAPGHLRQDRQLRRHHRHARRHEEAVLRLRPVRAEHVGVDDDQRPGADDPRDVHEHRDRPAGREVPARRRRRAGTRRTRKHRGAVRRPQAPALQRRAARGQRRPRPGPARRHRRPGRRRRDLRADQGATPWPPCAAPCRPTSSRKTRRRTPASSAPSSRCA